jgi:hypothetical protein
MTRLNSGRCVGPVLIGLVPGRVVHHLDHVSVGIPEEAGHFAVTHPGFSLKGDAHAGQIGQPTVPVFHLHSEVVGLVGLRIRFLMKVKFRASQLQEPRTLLGPFRIEDFFVPLLAPRHVAGLDVRMLDATDPDAALRHK